MRSAAVCSALLLLSIAMVFPQPASAHIKGYNAAVLRGDFAAAAKEAEAAWATLDKSRPDAVLTAREFAWTAMLVGQRDQARTYAKWLVEEAPALSSPDNEPVLSRVLLAWSELGDSPNKEARAALSNALREWEALQKPGSRVAVVAGVQLYSREWTMGEWEAAQQSALLAARLAATLGAEGAVYEERAKVDAAAAQFMADRKIDAWFALADAHDALMVRMGPPVPGEKVDDLNAIDMRAHAWLQAMDAYFGAGQRELSTNITWKRQFDRLRARTRLLKSRCGDEPCPEPVIEGAAPKCAARWDQSPPIRYPQMALFRGIVGATILEMSTDESGAVTAAKVLAAVPSEAFPDAALKTVQKWKLVRDSKATQPCTLAGTRTLYINFRMP